MDYSSSGFSYKKWDNIVDSDEEGEMHPNLMQGLKNSVYPSQPLVEHIHDCNRKFQAWNPNSATIATPSLLMCYYWNQDETLMDLKAKHHPEDVLLIGGGNYAALYSIAVKESDFIMLPNCPNRPIPTLESARKSIKEFLEEQAELQEQLKKQDFSPFARNNGFVQNGEACLSVEGNRWNRTVDGGRLFESIESHVWLHTLNGASNFVCNNAGFAILSVAEHNTDMMRNLNVCRSQIIREMGIGRMLFVVPAHPRLPAHADLMYCWLDDTTLLVNDYEYGYDIGYGYGGVNVGGAGMMQQQEGVEDADEVDRDFYRRQLAGVYEKFAEQGIRVVKLPYRPAWCASRQPRLQRLQQGQQRKQGRGVQLQADDVEMGGVTDGGDTKATAAPFSVASPPPPPSTPPSTAAPAVVTPSPSPAAASASAAFASMGLVDTTGIYVQCLVTPHAVYVPTFGEPDLEATDLEAYVAISTAVAASSSAKSRARPVVGISCRALAQNSEGSLHSMFTQLEGAPAVKLLAELTKSMK